MKRGSGRIRLCLVIVLLITAGLLVSPSRAAAEAWTFTYSHSGERHTYSTKYATKQEAMDAFAAWKRDRYADDRNPPQFVRANYLPNANPDRKRSPY